MLKPKITFVVALLAAIYICCTFIQCEPAIPTDPKDVNPDLESVMKFLKNEDYANNESWKLFPGTDTSGDTLKRLGLPVHGRWVRTYVNSVAYDFLKIAIDSAAEQPLDFPAGSFIVKQNYRSDFDSIKTISPDRSTLGVITLLYKPDPKFDYCVTDHLAPYNGDDCYGGDWFYGFFFQEDLKDCVPSKKSRKVQMNVNSFCVNCHAPGFNTDYVRTLDNIRNPFAEPSKTPYCDRFDPASEILMPLDKPTNSSELQNLKNLISSYNNDGSLSPNLPRDVPANPTKVFNHLGAEATQRMFDTYAWKSFIALNWPNKGDNSSTGKPQRGEANKNLPFTANSDTPSVWETYKSTFEVFQPSDISWNPIDQHWNQKPPQIVGTNCENENHHFVITMGSKTRDVVNETGQAFAGTFGFLVDQDKKRVRYEVLFNRTEFEYLVGNGRAATVNLTPSGPKGYTNKVNFPDTKDDEKYKEGSMEIKSAWKELCLTNDCNHKDAENLDEASQKFLVRNALIYNADSTSCRIAPMALIGLHIARKTFYAPQWIWITFEHKDNAPDRDSVANGGTFYNPKLTPLPNCYQLPFLANIEGIETCPNVDLNRFDPALTDAPNQLTRLVPLNKAAKTTNSIFQKSLSNIGSPFANYILVDTQWPLHGRNAAGQVNKLNCKDNEMGENCFTSVPRFLRNTVIESYMAAYCNSGDEAVQFSNRSCMSCHGTAGADLSYVYLDAVSQRVKLKK